jgi:hypothetical protein
MCSIPYLAETKDQKEVKIFFKFSFDPLFIYDHLHTPKIKSLFSTSPTLNL